MGLLNLKRQRDVREKDVLLRDGLIFQVIVRIITRVGLCIAVCVWRGVRVDVAGTQ